MVKKKPFFEEKFAGMGFVVLQKIICRKHDFNAYF
jgi:hypothetical protein